MIIRWKFMIFRPRLDVVNLRDSLRAALVATIWGFNFVVIAWGMDSVPPLLFAALRFTLVAFPAVLFLPRPDAPWRVVAGVGGFMSLGQFGFLYVEPKRERGNYDQEIFLASRHWEPKILHRGDPQNDWTAMMEPRRNLFPRHWLMQCTSFPCVQRRRNRVG